MLCICVLIHRHCKNARIAQSVVRVTVNHKVGGSIPPLSAFFICKTHIKKSYL